MEGGGAGVGGNRLRSVLEKSPEEVTFKLGPE